MNALAENPRERIGGNEPPLAKTISEQENFAQTVTDFLADEFKGAIDHADELLAEARELPKEIDGDQTKGKYTGLIKRIRDHAKKLDAYHEKEGTPYLRGKQAVDQFFFGPIDKLSRRAKANKPGAADILNDRLTAYDTRILAERQAELRRQADEAERIAREAQQRADREAREAEEKRQAAERARKPAHVESKSNAAAEAEAAAAQASAEAQASADQAERAHIASLAKAADLMRQRGDDGTLSTMATEPYALVTDDKLLDKEKLWPFIPLAAKEQALRAFAKNTGYTVKMEGASIGKKPKSQVR
jgi:hypothetical protein